MTVGELCRCVYERAAVLHNHRVHEQRQPAGLPEARQQGSDQRRGVDVHRYADSQRHELPGEQVLHTQVRDKSRH